MNTHAIEAQHLRKTYPGFTAVHDLTLAVARGEVFGFLGPNGAGKTTTVKMLLGLVKPSSGQARLLGRAINDPEARRKVGFLPELFRFHDWLTGEEFLRFHGRLYGLAGAELERRIPEVLELVGLAGRGRDRLRTYSKGMQQRAGLAGAIIHRPEVVFLDEPTSALDPIGRIEVREIIARLKGEGLTVFLNSHLLSEVEQTCDRVAIVNRGRVVREGSLESLLAARPQLELRVNRVTPELEAALAAFASVLERSGNRLRLELPSEDAIPRVADIVVRSGLELHALVPERAQLEDVFVDLVQADTARGDA